MAELRNGHIYRDRVSSSYHSGSPSSTTDALFRMTPLSDKSRTHLRRVYSTLFYLLGMASIGCLVQFMFALPAFAFQLGSIGFLIWFVSMTPSNYKKRSLSLMGFAGCTGASLAPLIELLAAYSSYWMVFTALSATAIIFACFSISAIMAKRREYLYLGAWLSSALSIMFWAALISMFIPNQLSHILLLYGGLIIYSGFVIYDTQLIIEKAEMLDKPDVLGDALHLFTDFVAVLRRVLVILLDKERKKEKESRK